MERQLTMFQDPVVKDDVLKDLRTKLGLQPSASPSDVCEAGLKAEDPEVMRRALSISPQCGLEGSPQHVEAENRIRSANQLPSDWNIAAFCGGNFLEGGSGGRQESTVVAFVEQPPQIMQEIQALFDGTYRKVYTRDRRGVPIPDRFEVKEVVRVMNGQVWREYAGRREEIRKRVAGTTPTVPEGTRTMTLLKGRPAPVLPELNAAVNEQWLFHGTTRDAAKGIGENDFRLDLTGSNAGTLYGKGIYLAENATKSDEYGEGPKGPAGEEAEIGTESGRNSVSSGPPPEIVRESYMLLCRSALGKVFYTDEQRPNADELVRKCTSNEFDSVLGDRLKKNGTFREIVVYNDDNVYPEYIIRYERIFFHDRFADIYRQMALRQQQNRFVGPTAEEIEVLQSMWNVYGMPNKGRINKWQLLDLLKAVNQPPADEGEDLDATFNEWDKKQDGWIDWDEFREEMCTRVRDGVPID